MKSIKSTQSRVWLSIANKCILSLNLTPGAILQPLWQLANSFHRTFTTPTAPQVQKLPWMAFLLSFHKTLVEIFTRRCLYFWIKTAHAIRGYICSVGRSPSAESHQAKGTPRSQARELDVTLLGFNEPPGPELKSTHSIIAAENCGSN